MKWTVTHGQQAVFIESTQPDGTVSIDIPDGPFVAPADAIREVRTKLGLAINDAQAGDKPQAQDAECRGSQRGEDHG